MDLHHQTTTTTTTTLNPDTSEPEGSRLLAISSKLLQTRDLAGSKEFALLAQETDPFLEGSDQILAITDVLLASEKRILNNLNHDWYAILQTNPQSLSFDHDLLKKNYRRLSLLLHPDKNRYPFAEQAFKLVADAWTLLSDDTKRGDYDRQINQLQQSQFGHQSHDKDKLPIRRNNVRSDGDARFWTACPYCYNMYEYPKKYENCCLRCRNCERGFHGTVVNSLPPLVEGKEAYYCCWGFFPLGFSFEDGKKGGSNSGFPNWMPAGAFTTPVAAAAVPQGGGVGGSGGGDGGGKNNVSTNVGVKVPTPGSKKRGRPKKSL